MKRKPMSELEIASRVRKQIEFNVGSERERKLALSASKFLGIGICTRKNDDNGFTVKFIKV